jgi:hypothetical protein
MVVVKLETVDPDELNDLLSEAWRTVASKKFLDDKIRPAPRQIR